MLTSPYAKLVEIAPGKKPKRTRKPRAKKVLDPAIAFMRTKRLPLQVPAGTKRYYLSVPYRSKEQAARAGCKWDENMQRWYIDNPQHVSDFARWNPSLVGFEKLVKQLKSQ